MATKWILAGIDGTGSRTWLNKEKSNSHVWRFVSAFNHMGGKKSYFHGPSDGGIANATGSIDSNFAVLKVRNFITDSIMELVPEVKTLVKQQVDADMKRFTYPRKEHGQPPLTRDDLIYKGYRQDLKIAEKIREANICFCLVGHSRGGAIATSVAERIPVPVHFLGLFDSVDRALLLLTGEVENVRYTYHALRHPSLNSRNSFGNSPTKSQQYYASKYFKTSHGGIGGDVVLENRSMIGDDSCTLGFDTKTQKFQKGSIAETCIKESKNAYDWMIEKARIQELPV